MVQCFCKTLALARNPSISISSTLAVPPAASIYSLADFEKACALTVTARPISPSPQGQLPPTPRVCSSWRPPP
jgi:hypothetical protein